MYFYIFVSFVSMLVINKSRLYGHSDPDPDPDWLCLHGGKLDSNPDSDHLSHVDCDPDSNPDSGPGARVNAAIVYNPILCVTVVMIHAYIQRLHAVYANFSFIFVTSFTYIPYGRSG